MPSPPNLREKGSNFLSFLVQVIPPEVDDINSVSIIFSIRRICVDSPLMIRLCVLLDEDILQ